MATIGALIYKLGLDTSALTENTRQAGDKLSTLDGFAKKAGAALAGMVSVAAVTAAVSKYTEFTGRISDLADATGVSIGGVQALEYAAKQSGSSFDTVAKGIGKMSSGLVEGDKSTVAGLKTLGLSLGDLRQMAPEQAFTTIADAIAKVPNPMRQSALATDLFGKSGREMLPMIKAGVGDVADEARRMGLVLSDDAVAAGDAFGDTMDRLSTVGMSLLSAVLEPIIPVLTMVADALARGVGPALASAREGFNAIVSAGMSAIGRLYDLAAAGVELAVKFGGPVAKALGLNSETAQGLRASARWYADAATANRQLTTAASAAAPAIAQMAPPLRETGEASEAARKKLEAFQKSLDEATGMAAYRKAVEAMEVIQAAGRRIDPEKYLELAKGVQAGVDAASRLQIAVPAAMSQVAASASEAGGSLGDFLKTLLSIDATMRGIEAQPPLFAKALQLGGPTKMPVPVKGLGRTTGGSGLWDGLLGTGGLLEKQAGNLLKGQWGAVAGAVGQQLGTNVVSTYGKAITGALGSTIGGIANAFIPAIGSLLGPLVGAITGLFDKSAGNAQRAAHAYGIQLSDALSKGIVADSKGLFGGNFQAAAIFNLSKMIDESGGVTQQSTAKWARAAQDIFSMVQTGRFTAEQAAKAFDPVFSRLAAHLTETGGLASDQFRRLIALTDEYGVKSQAVTAWVKTGVATAAEGFTAFLSTAGSAHQGVLDGHAQIAELEKAIAAATTDAERHELTKRQVALAAHVQEQERLLQTVGLASQAAASGMGAALWGMFDTLQQRGLPVTDALAQMAPAVAAFQAELARTGYTGGEAFGSLQRLAALAADDLAGPALGSVQGLGQGLTALWNTGLLNEEMFSGLAGQIGHTFGRLLEAGKPADDVLRLMQPQLQTLWELWKSQGWAIDEATEKMLAQAEASGLVGDRHKSATDRMVDATERMAKSLDRLVDQLASALPAAADAGARGVETALGGIQPPTVHLPIRYDLPDAWPEAPDWGVSGGAYHTGGLVSVARRATGAVAVPWSAVRAHGGLAVGEVPAILQTGEFVLSRRGVQAAGLSALAALNRGEAGGAPGVAPGPVTLDSPDLRALRGDMAALTAVLRHLPEHTARAVKAAVLLAAP